MTALQKLQWRKVAALTQDGAKYSDYMSTLQDEFQNNNIEFIMNRKFPKEATDMSMYLRDLKERGAKIIIGEFYASSARQIMCAAYQAGMTQREGYVWFLPGWFDDQWYDIDQLRKKKAEHEAEEAAMAENRTAHGAATGGEREAQQQGANIEMFEDTAVGILPQCSTREMLLALDGHLSLVHANFAPDSQSVQQGRRTVAEWKQVLRARMAQFKRDYNQVHRSQAGMEPPQQQNSTQAGAEISKGEKNTSLVTLNKYSGYVYDAVWLYALALNKLITTNASQSFVQNLHSEQTVEEFVRIIRTTDFEGVSGRINFKDRPSRLSNVRIIQWLRRLETKLLEVEVRKFYSSLYTLFDCIPTIKISRQSAACNG